MSYALSRRHPARRVPLNAFSRKSVGLMLLAIVLTGGTIGGFTKSAHAQSVLQEQGSLQPMQQAHVFSGEAGQTVTVSVSSGEFDTYVVLLAPNGQEIAANDDYGRSLNSSIVVTLPETGQYQVVARSFSGQGGSYSVSVRPATPFDQAYARGTRLVAEGKLSEAAVALSEAIQIDPGQPAPYLDRGEVAFAQGNLPSAVADFQQAADLYEQAGNRQAAIEIRQQLEALKMQEAP